MICIHNSVANKVVDTPVFHMCSCCFMNFIDFNVWLYMIHLFARVITLGMLCCTAIIGFSLDCTDCLQYKIC